ncbi:ribonuclease R family protein [Terriglobus aquaticus]|uniref:Ribonuclease R n=1 Tax=Terriglobus aquaticus TaxID=940139 RepID=A0ABW9KNC2_9BACT|nr:RNB domain-containing ribonuclease [Terriglobus aquaticus]
MSGHPYPQTDRELLRRMERGGGRATYKQLVRELGIGGGRERRLLLEQLAKMTARGALVKVDREQWAVPRADDREQGGGSRPGGGNFGAAAFAPGRSGGRRGFAAEMAARVRGRQRASAGHRDDLMAGRLSLHRDGFGFVRPNGAEGQDSDIFIPPHDLNSAMQGDQVLVDAGPPTREGRRAGRVVRVLTRRNPTVVGIFHASGARGRSSDFFEGSDPRSRGAYVVPFDTRVARVVLIPDEHDLPAAAITPHRTLGEEAMKQEHRWDGTAENLTGLAVDVEITQFPTEHSPARGRVIEVLGDPNGFGVDVEIVIRKHHLPHVFPAEVLAEAQEAAQWNVAALLEEQGSGSTEQGTEAAGRRDFRDEPIVTIDGETAKDFDDAVLVRALDDGTFELQVHIADVAEYVADGTALDLEARLRGNSVYFPDRAIPMLPQELSNGECSLRPDEDRLVLSCVAQIDSQGNVLGYEVCEGMIRSARRMTYTKVQKILDGDAELREEYAPFVADFELMLDLAKRLNGKRVRRGSIDFDLPEPVIEFDERGAMRGVVRSERAWANRLIEEFMLCANECVARWVEAQGVPGMYRIHEQPDAKKIVEFEDQAAEFGYTLGVGPLPVQVVKTKGDKREAHRRNERDRDRGRSAHREARGHQVVGAIDVSPKLYQRLTEKIAGKPEERILSYLMLRSLKQAKYSADNEGHFALAAPSYTHFTSPIRRYPDLVVHRVVKTLLREGASPIGEAEETASQSARNLVARERSHGRSYTRNNQEYAPPYAHDEIAAIAQECSETERRAADAERELIELKKLQFMADRVGEEFDAIVLSVTKYGFFVELNDLFVEGLVPIYTLQGDHFTYRETQREIKGGATGFVYRPGMRVRVLLDRIDRENRRLQFAVVDDEAEPSVKPDQPANRSSEAPAGTKKFVSKKGKASAKQVGAAARDTGASARRPGGKSSKSALPSWVPEEIAHPRKKSNKQRSAEAKQKKRKKR